MVSQFQVEAAYQLDGPRGCECPFFDAFAIERIQDLIETTKAVGYVVALLIDRDMCNPDGLQSLVESVRPFLRNPVTDLAHFQKVFFTIWVILLRCHRGCLIPPS